MKKILRIGRGVKVRRARVREICDLPIKAMDVDARTEVIQALIPLGLWHVKEVLEQEVEALAGERYNRQGMAGFNRWGRQWGSVYLGDQNVPIPVPSEGSGRGQRGPFKELSAAAGTSEWRRGSSEADPAWINAVGAMRGVRRQYRRFLC